MSGRGNDWGEFMQSRPVQIALNGLCTLLCAGYAVDGVLEMLSPERSATMMQVIGATGYYILTIARIVVCAWVALVFGRMTVRAIAGDGDGK